MNSQLEKLAEYGVNISEVMARFVDDRDLYMECLALFIADPSFEALRAALLACDYSAAFDYAHTLKGVAGNLGVTPLYNTICAIAESLRSGDYQNLGQQFKSISEEKQRLEKLLDGETI